MAIYKVKENNGIIQVPEEEKGKELVLCSIDEFLQFEKDVSSIADPALAILEKEIQTRMTQEEYTELCKLIKGRLYAAQIIMEAKMLAEFKNI